MIFNSVKIWGSFHSTKNFENFKIGTNNKDISKKRFQKMLKLLNFRTANHSTENFGRKTEISENSGYSFYLLARKSSFPQISLKADPLVTGKFTKIRTNFFQRMESIQDRLCLWAKYCKQEFLYTSTLSRLNDAAVMESMAKLLLIKLWSFSRHFKLPWIWMTC